MKIELLLIVTQTVYVVAFLGIVVYLFRRAMATAESAMKMVQESQGYLSAAVGSMGGDQDMPPQIEETTEEQYERTKREFLRDFPHLKDEVEAADRSVKSGFVPTVEKMPVGLAEGMGGA